MRKTMIMKGMGDILYQLYRQKETIINQVYRRHTVSGVWTRKTVIIKICGRHTVSVVWTRKTIIIKYVAYILYQAHGGDRL